MNPNDGKKNMKDKIEEILNRSLNKETVIKIDSYGVLDEIATLCDEQRADAVRGFLTWLNQRPIEGIEVLIDFSLVEEYLKEQNI